MARRGALRKPVAGASASRVCVAVRAVGARARRAAGGLCTLAALPLAALPFSALPFSALPFSALPFSALPFAALSSQAAVGPLSAVGSTPNAAPRSPVAMDDARSVFGPRVTAPWPSEDRREDRRQDPPFGLSPWWAPVMSAIAPGAGQGLLRQQRGVVYAAAEVYFVVRAIEASRDARRERDAYRDIARRVARAPFPGDRPDGAWAYYERLQYFLESGAYNRTPAGAFTPETDESTFNGSIWRLARETFWRDPDEAPAPDSEAYRRAISFYQARAVDDAFRWSWRDAQLEQDVYRQTIDRSNDAARRARQMAGLVLANHALSLVDAYVGVRLRVFADGAGATQRVGVAGALPIGRAGGRR